MADVKLLSQSAPIFSFEGDKGNVDDDQPPRLKRNLSRLVYLARS